MRIVFWEDGEVWIDSSLRDVVYLPPRMCRFGPAPLIGTIGFNKRRVWHVTPWQGARLKAARKVETK